MSLFSKILAKLGLRKEQPTVTGTTKFVHNDPRTADSDRRSAHAGMPTNAAPTSEKKIRATGALSIKKAKEEGAIEPLTNLN